VATSTNENVVITTATGTRTQLWSYPGRQDCLTCHTIPSGGVLGVKTRQLNGNFGYPATAVTDNQIRAWNHVGFFNPVVSDAAIPSYDKLVSVSDSNSPLELRVRSFLDANCAHCHRPNGGVQANFDARFDTALAGQGLVGGAAQNSLGIMNAYVVAPGDTNRSILFQRDNSLAAIKMPPLAKNVIDTNAMSVMASWIMSLPPLSNALPFPWQHTDIGNVGLAGGATYAGGQFTVTGSGADIWGLADAGHFTYLPLTGDGQIVARVVAVQKTDGWAKAGVMFRETLASNSKHAFMIISATNGAQFQRRLTTGGNSSANVGGPAVTAPYWVQLTRAGNVFTGSISSNGTSWVQVDIITNAMSSQVSVGFAVTAHNNTLINTSVVDNVTVSSASNTTPAVAITVPTNGAIIPFGANLMLTATATAANGGITNVSFQRELTKLGEATSAPYSFIWNSAPAGSFTLRASAADSFGVSATSAPVNVTILAPQGWSAFNVKVNFQTNTAPMVAGYLPDYGDIFGNRGNGFSYGWDTNNVANTRYRNSAFSFDTRYDTFNHLQKIGGGTTWEIAVPNGLYQVRIVSGDATAFDGNFRLSAEGMVIVNGAPTTTARWVEGIGTVTVNDGRLTVDNAAGATNNKICFIEIASLAAPPPSQLVAPTVATNGALQFTLQGSAGRSYIIEGSTNLLEWFPLFTNAPASNTLPFMDLSATNFPARYYRGREQ
jgi:regulation of enolase protein 1 (concanavalin A-like superfamily)